jgi:hypothetical protein
MLVFDDKTKYLFIGLNLKFILPLVVFFSILNSIFEVYQTYLDNQLDSQNLLLIVYLATFVPVFFLVRFIIRKILFWWYTLSCQRVQDIEEFTRLAFKLRLIKSNTPIPKVSRIGQLNIREEVMNLLGSEGAKPKNTSAPIVPSGDETVIYYSQKWRKKMMVNRILLGLISSFFDGLQLVMVLGILFVIIAPDDFKSTGARIFGISLLTGFYLRALWPTITAIRCCFNPKLMILSREKIIIYYVKGTLHNSFMNSISYNGTFDPEWYYIQNFEINGTQLSFDYLSSAESRILQKVSFDIKNCDLPTDELWSYLEFYFNEYKKNPDKRPPKTRFTFSFLGAKL